MNKSKAIVLLSMIAGSINAYGAGSCVVCPTGAICAGGAEQPIRCQAGTWLNYNKIKLYDSGPNAGQPILNPAGTAYVTEVVCDECPTGMLCPEGTTAPLANAIPPGSIIMMTNVNKGFDLRDISTQYPDLTGWKHGLSPMPDCPNKSTMEGSAITTKCPPGYLLADGSTLNIEDYPALFGAIGETYGYDTRYSTFKLPDFRGRFLRMSGNNAAAIGTAQEDGVKTHTHPIPHTHNFDYDYIYTALYGTSINLGSSQVYLPGGHITKQVTDFETKPASPANSSTNTAPSPDETRPVNYSVLYYIRY